jgi:ABC-type phosphate transport system substrate-binding protein
MVIKKKKYSSSSTTTSSSSALVLIAIMTAVVATFVITSNIASPAAAATTASNTTTTTTTTTKSSSGIELSPQPLYQEHVRDVSETLINQTHAQLIVEGNGTLSLPNSTETIRTTSTGRGIVSIISTFAGKEILTTEDGRENATASS